MSVPRTLFLSHDPTDPHPDPSDPQHDPTYPHHATTTTDTEATHIGHVQ